jgi:hypothetical protein
LKPCPSQEGQGFSSRKGEEEREEKKKKKGTPT